MDIPLVVCLSIFLLSNIGIGYYAYSKVHNTEDFILAGRNLPISMATATVFATWFGSETLVGASSRFVEKGVLGIIEDPFGAAICLLLIGIFFAKKLYRLKLRTFCDFYKIRFGQKSEFMASVLMVPSYFGWIAAQFVAMGIVIHSVSGLPLMYGILISACIVGIYTCIGGMWAVTLTDFIQTLLIVSGVLAVGIFAWIEWNEVPRDTIVIPKDFFSFTPPIWTPSSFWEYVAAWITVGLGSIPQQDVFQRVMSSKNENIAVWSSIIGGIMYLTVAFLPLFLALGIFFMHPDYGKEDLQLLIPEYVLHTCPFFIKVWFLGAMLSAVMSTSSGALLAPASILSENLILPHIKAPTDKGTLLLLRSSVVIVALSSLLMAWSQSNIYELVAASSVFSLVCLFIPMIAGMFWKRSSSLGSHFSMIGGILSWILFAWIETEIPSFILALGISFLGMIVGSFISKDGSELHLEMELIIEESKR